MTSAPICAWCKQPAKGLATIGDDHYCHEGDSPTCYELAGWAAMAGLNPDEINAAKAHVHPSAFLAGLRDQAKWLEEQWHDAGAEERRYARAAWAAHALAQGWINDDDEPATDHGVTAQTIRAACGQQLLATLNKRPGSGGPPAGINRYCTECRRWTNHEGPQHPSDETILAIARETSDRWRETLDLLAEAEKASPETGGEVGTDAGEGAPRQDTASAWVTRSMDCPAAPAQAHLPADRLSEEEHEALFDALGDFATNSPNLRPDMPEVGALLAAVVPVVERIVAKRLAEVEQERDGWKRAYEVADRRVAGHVQERVTLVRRLHVAEQERAELQASNDRYEAENQKFLRDVMDEQERREAAEQERDLATATAADVVAKLDRLHDLLAGPTESRAGLLAQRMIRDALASKETP